MDRYPQQEPHVDAARTQQVDDIRARIARGEYAVDPGAVAQAILGRLAAASPAPPHDGA